MTLTEELSKSDQKWLLRWALWPAGLYLAGAFLSIYSVLFLPLTLTVVQYYLLDDKAGNHRPGLWFCMPLMYGLCFWCITLLPGWAKQLIGDQFWVGDFYISQCAGELLLFFIFNTWRWGWYTFFNLFAYSIWLLAFKLSEGSPYPLTSGLWLYLLIPIIGFFTNALTGYGLIKAVETTD
ncbi:hypothetical protein [uncultured Fibrella sp.]|uniref:hypothetical protein n=1 Tax=uncultured Fibrella sp. TaxID=1284596 RepID=UPI0035C94DB5